MKYKHHLKNYQIVATRLITQETQFTLQAADEADADDLARDILGEQQWESVQVEGLTVEVTENK